MGAEKDIIIAVELGSSAIRAIAGKREPDGTMQVLALAQEEAVNAIRKGVVDNIDKTTQAISRVIGQLNDKLGIYTTRIFVGLAGQSLHTQLNVVPYVMEEKKQITNRIVDELKDINNGVVYPDSKILGVVPQEYRIGSRSGVLEPEGMISDMLEAHFMNIIARSSLGENIERCVRNAGLELADLLISPLCLADCLLTPNEKRAGCALVDFGADTTTVSVFTNNILRHLAVIPLGGANVTRDITTSGVETEEAENLKLKYGCASHEATEDEKKHNIQLNFGRTITESELQEIIEARYEEIIVNAGKQISNYSDKLLSGIMLTGGASRAKGLEKAFSTVIHFDKQIRIAKGLPMNIVLAPSVEVSETDNLYTLFALLLKGDQNCASDAPVETEAEETQDIAVPEEADEAKVEQTDVEPEEKETEEKTSEGIKTKVGGFWTKLKKMLEEPEED